MKLKLSWEKFKANYQGRGLYPRFIEGDDRWVLVCDDGAITTFCSFMKDSNEESDFLTVQSQFNISGQKEVVTLLEKEDKSLKLASIEGSFSGNLCVLEIKIPGTLGKVGRYIGGGYGFTDVYFFGDRITKAELVDKEFVYAGLLYPATPAEAGIPGTQGLGWIDVVPDGQVLGSYHDTEVDSVNSGWRLWCDDGNQGGCDIDPLGGYGKLYAQAYLRITFEKKASSSATKAAVDLWWGEKELV